MYFSNHTIIVYEFYHILVEHDCVLCFQSNNIVNNETMTNVFHFEEYVQLYGLLYKIHSLILQIYS